MYETIKNFIVSLPIWQAQPIKNFITLAPLIAILPIPVIILRNISLYENHPCGSQDTGYALKRLFLCGIYYAVLYPYVGGDYHDPNKNCIATLVFVYLTLQLVCRIGLIFIGSFSFSGPRGMGIRFSDWVSSFLWKDVSITTFKERKARKRGKTEWDDKYKSGSTQSGSAYRSTGSYSGAGSNKYSYSYANSNFNSKAYTGSPTGNSKAYSGNTADTGNYSQSSSGTSGTKSSSGSNDYYDETEDFEDYWYSQQEEAEEKAKKESKRKAGSAPSLYSVC